MKIERKVPEKEVLEICKELELLKVSTLLNRLRKQGYKNIHYTTVRKYLDDLVRKGILLCKEYPSEKSNYIVRWYRVLGKCEGEGNESKTE